MDCPLFRSDRLSRAGRALDHVEAEWHPRPVPQSAPVLLADFIGDARCPNELGEGRGGPTGLTRQLGDEAGHGRVGVVVDLAQIDRLGGSASRAADPGTSNGPPASHPSSGRTARASAGLGARSGRRLGARRPSSAWASVRCWVAASASALAFRSASILRPLNPWSDRRRTGAQVNRRLIKVS